MSESSANAGFGVVPFRVSFINFMLSVEAKVVKYV